MCIYILMKNVYLLKRQIMKKILFFLFFLCSAGNVAAQKDVEAKKILDKAASEFSKAGGVEIGFTLKSTQTMRGTLKIKGQKFQLQTPSSITWYDGKTQWTYLESSEEVNISIPTAEELQQINPHAWVTCYKKGFDYKYNGTVGNAYKITLTPEQPNQEVKQIVLLLKRTDYTPFEFMVTDRNGQSHTISVHTYRTKQNYSDTIFRFDSKSYPRAEVIDLR